MAANHGDSPFESKTDTNSPLIVTVHDLIHEIFSTEFAKDSKIYDLISKIYNILGNEELSKKISNPDSRMQAINALKKEVTGISQKE